MFARKFAAGLTGICAILLLSAQAALAQAPPPGPGRGPAMNPEIPQNAGIKVSDHVHAIMAFPNIFIVTGTRATLVVDTGLGPAEGAIVATEAQKLAKNQILYLTTTHYHPEHAAGDAGFPSNTILVRPAIQQQEIEKDGMRMVGMFSGMNARNAELLKDVKFRAPDIVFDKETTLDLGGVTAKIFWLGPAHTSGDELIYVNPDKALISGDIVQNKMLPNPIGAGSSLTSWINILAQLKTMDIRYVDPDHGALGDGSLITDEYNFLNDLKTRTLDLKRQGKSADEAGPIVASDLKTKYPAWPNNGVPGLVGHIYSENP